MFVIVWHVEMKEDWQLVGDMLFGFSGLLGSFGSRKSGFVTLPQFRRQGAAQNNVPRHNVPQPEVQDGEGGPDVKVIGVPPPPFVAVGAIDDTSEHPAGSPET